jgi:hypothetical protein
VAHSNYTVPMRASTIRRLIVFGVCSLGVGGLYLVPGMARTPAQVGYRAAGDQPTAEPSAPTATRAGAAGAAAGRGAVKPATADQTAVAAGGQQAGSAPTTSQRRQSSARPTTGTAFDASDDADSTSPDPVSGISFGPVTTDTLTVSWAPAHDNVGVIGYRIWLNGFEVATTVETHVTVNWFNDDLGQHVVQVKALDAAGNQSKVSSNVLVDRPTPTPTAQPTPSSTPTSSAPAITGTPSAKPTARPHGWPTGPSTGQR